MLCHANISNDSVLAMEKKAKTFYVAASTVFWHYQDNT